MGASSNHGGQVQLDCRLPLGQVASRVLFLTLISERRFLSGGQDPVLVGFQHSTLQFSKLYH